MVRVPGSLGDSEFHCESHEEAHADLRSGKPASSEIESPTKPLNQDRSADRQSFGRGSTDGTEEGQATDLEEKPLPPPQVSSETPADFDSHRDLQDDSPSTKAKQRLASKPSMKKKSAKSKPLRKKMKAPESDADGQDNLKAAWTYESLEITYHKKELHTFLIKNPAMQIIKPKIMSDLEGTVQKPTARSSKLEAAKALLHPIKECGIIAESFDANDLFDTRLSTINTAVMSIFDLLKPLVGEKNVTPKIATRSTDDMLRSRDGTYKLHFGGGHSFPLEYWVYVTSLGKSIGRKTTFGYARMFYVYKERRHEFFGGTMNMHFGSMDHSDAIANAFREVWPDIKLLNCWSRLEQKSREKRALLLDRERYSDIIRPQIGYLSQARSLDQFIVLSELVTQNWTDLGEDEYAQWLDNENFTDPWDLWFYAASGCPGVVPNQNPIEAHHRAIKSTAVNHLRDATIFR
ncbi:hypothetical protein PHPALM_30504 [Phytophthora palmivora]|uniref:Uncharacterized protein n=1 Tax=Phytophthora palmivora TaxID=4796 RepID=A0A2P4X502_9STRA|nr:hypothetical protein PHPALM_30504 [Phytophthora palmivora]